MQTPAISIDLSGLGETIVNAVIDGISHVASPIPFNLEKWLIEQLQGVLSTQGAHNLLTHIPLEWTSQNPEVLSLWRQMIIPEVGLTAVVLAIQGYRVSAGKAEFWEVLMRTGFLSIMGLSMSFWSDQILNIVNHASDAIGSTPLDMRAETVPNELVIGFMLIVALFLSGLAWIKGAVGVVFIAVLIASAPFVLTLSALPLLDGLGTWWAKEFTVWAMRPIMVALVLRIGLAIGLVNSGGLQLLFAIVAFWLAYKMDTHIRSFSVGAWGSVSQLGLFTRGARLAAGAFSGGATATAGAAASATP
jgi:hypothetical protein